MNFVSLLTVAFITLKLTGIIDWSWWLVLSPFPIGLSLMILFSILVKRMEKRSDNNGEEIRKLAKDLLAAMKNNQQKSDSKV